jgi:hypothetical protein
MSNIEKVGRIVIALASKGAPPTIEEWTADNEVRWPSLQENKINLENTAMGTKRVLCEQQMVASSITR